MHPIKFKLTGKNLAGIKDRKGKFLFLEFNKMVKENGEGWVDYQWPKPGEKKASQKVSFVKKCVDDGDELVLGCGVYGLKAADITK